MSTPETEKKRTRRSVEERAAEVDAKIEAVNHSITELEAKKQAAIASYDEKIAAAQERIQSLESKKAAILAPKPKTKRKPRKTKKQMIQNIMKQAQKAGMKPQEIAERLGLPIEEYQLAIDILHDRGEAAPDILTTGRNIFREYRLCGKHRHVEDASSGAKKRLQALFAQ